MLQTNMPQTDSTSPSGATQGNPLDGGIGGLAIIAISFLRRQYLVMGIVAAIGVAAGAYYLLTTPPTYTAQAQIILANPPQFVQQQSLAPAFDVSQIETQLQIIRSRAIAVAVINQLHLEEDPDVNGSGGGLRGIRAWFSTPPQAEARKEPREDVVNAFLERLLTSRVTFANVIEVSYSSSSPQRAAEIANAVAKAYIADQMNAKLEANRMATNWLQERLRDLSEQALTAERAVSEFRSQNNISTSGGQTIEDQKVSDLNNRLTAARAQMSEALVRLNRYETMLRTNSSDPSSVATLDTTGRDGGGSQIINGLRDKYLEMGRRESEWKARFGPDHRVVVELNTKMKDLSASILDEVRRLAESAKGELEIAKLRQEEIEKLLAEAISQSRSASSAEMTIRSMENQAKTLRGMYETFLQRYTGFVQQETFPITETRILSPAAPPQVKSKPNTGKVMALALFGGIALGIALGMFRDILDRAFRTSAQIESALKLPCLSLVPLLRDMSQAESVPPPQQAEEDLRSRVISTATPLHHYVTDLPSSPFAEAIRSIKLAIDLRPDKTFSNIIGITSALPNEGKTAIAASLAQLIGHIGKKVIAVDCDLRNPTLSASFAPGAATGLIDIINGKASIEETIWRDPQTGLAFLPTVHQGPLFNTSDILSAEAMHKLFAQLRGNYDYIIVDLPPITPLVDIRVTSTLIDCFILAVEWGETKIEVVKHALHIAPNIRKSMIGAVLNKTDFEAMIRYDSNWSDFHNEKYYARYGLSQSGTRA